MQTELGHVFISYRRAEPDLGFAQKLAADLRAAGHPVWIDVEGIVGADEWAREIQSAIDACYAYILVLSPDSVESAWVRKELIYAMAEKPGRIYPVLFRDTRLPFELYNVQYGDFLHQDYETAFDLLLGDLPSPPTELPRELLAALESNLGTVRRGAVATLIEIAQGDNPDQASQAVARLQYLCENDPDEQVCAAAERFFRPVEPTPFPAMPPPLPEPIETLSATPAEPAPGFTLKPWLGIAAGLVVVAALVGIALGIGRGGRNNPAAISGALDTPTDEPTTAASSTPEPAPTGTPFPAASESAAVPVPTVTPTLAPTPFGGGSGAITFVADSPDRPGKKDIYRIEVSGGTVTRLTPAEFVSSELTGLETYEWSADGSQMAVFDGLRNVPPYNVYKVDAEGGSLVTLAETVAVFAWSPDGQRIVYQPAYSSDLYIADSNGQDAQIVPLEAGYSWGGASYPDWSPDGEWLIVGDSEVKGTSGIARVEVATGRVVELTRNEYINRLPVFSPDGNYIAFDSTRAGARGIYIMNDEGGRVVPITDPSKEFGQLVGWWPDSSGILIRSNRNNRWDLFSASVDGGELELIQTDVDEVKLSPDGSRIAYTVADALWIIDADGSNPVQLNTGHRNIEYIAWQP